MRSTIIVATLTAAFMGCVIKASHAADVSPCKGLEQTVCTANAACKWQPERIAGQTLTQKGEPSKNSAKAHCRKGRPNAAAKVEKAPQ